MFDLLDRPLVFIPVKWAGVGEDATGNAVAVEHMVEIQVEILDRVEFAEWIKSGAGVPEADAVDEPGELTTFRKVAKGWRNVKKSPAFTDENIRKLLAWPGFVGAFGQAYLDVWQGRVEVREKNSDGSPANGPAVEPTDETKPAAI